MATFTDLPVITSSSITNNHVFAVATTTSTDQISLGELQKCFTGFTAPSSSSISIVGSTVPSGITVGSNGYVGIDNTNPQVALDIGDIGSATIAEVRLAARSAGRQASFTLRDNSVFWRSTKKASDTDYYIETSTDGSNFTGVLNLDINGNVGVSDGSVALTDKFFVKDGSVKFQSGTSGIMFDPGLCEIKTTVAGDILYINKNNSDDICLGDDVLYIENGATSYVGINTTTPEVLLDINGAGYSTRLKNTSTNTTNIGISNTTTTGFINQIGNVFSVGRFATNSDSNLAYNISTAKLGVGTSSPNNKLHIKSADQTLAVFEGSSLASHEVLQTNNNIAAAPTSSLYTFASGSPSSPNKKWSVGLYSVSPYSDAYVFLLDGSTSTSAVKASLSRNGDLDIQGSLTTDGAYTKGKFIEIHHTRVTGDCIYFNPFFSSSNTNPSGHNNNFAPFGIVPFSGRVERVQIFSSNTGVSGLTNSPRIEIVSVTPTFDSAIPSGFVSGFSVSPPSNPVSFPTSGIIGYASLGTMNPNQLLTINRSQFNGSTSFSSGVLLQYRIAEQNGTKSLPVDFSVVSTISYTVV